jgi:hypothetical protein
VNGLPERQAQEQYPPGFKILVISTNPLRNSSTCSSTPEQYTQSYEASVISGIERTSITKSQPSIGTTSDVV